MSVIENRTHPIGRLNLSNFRKRKIVSRRLSVALTCKKQNPKKECKCSSPKQRAIELEDRVSVTGPFIVFLL